MADYPKRESHFAHKFGRLIFRCCLANEIGADACYLLLQIAHTEDAARYRGPVTFFNEQLVSVCGCANVKALARLRQRAIDAGWLDYQPGGKGTAGRYFVTVPGSHKSVGDGSCESDLHPVSLVEIDQESGRKVGKEAGEKREESGQESGRKVGNILPKPTPGPCPNKTTTTTGDPWKEISLFVSRWNATPGTKPCDEIGISHGGQIVVERLGDPSWLADYPKALAKFPLPFFASKPDPNVSALWFFGEGILGKILTDAYAFTPEDPRKPKPPPKMSRPSLEGF